ncbi:hypothetical protein SBOR_6568 [Sclerotinia borealis F-4128]|uniref:FAD-binding domain-containing protein n=1 Tax=Sclerotinia borealis (strain F-4128) TaxID=1432307 RepID=W9C8G8_SCLBF|nr:hypothetical protein SBOR_6568 [Sclerotinia borealis F-4128]
MSSSSPSMESKEKPVTNQQHDAIEQPCCASLPHGAQVYPPTDCFLTSSKHIIPHSHSRLLRFESVKMTADPLNVLIVGGSLTALFHGIILRRLGHHVRILERHPPSRQMSLGAGIAAMEHVQSFIEKYDETKTPYSNHEFDDPNHHSPLPL